jgi:quinol monooxygenase YgiN
MTTISLSRNLVTLINVFTVEPRNQQRLLELLARVTESSVRYAPGFISASLHRGLDGTKVTMYAQWRSVEDYQAMRENPAPLPYLQQVLAIAKFDPGMYEVVEIFSGTKSEPYPLNWERADRRLAACCEWQEKIRCGHRTDRSPSGGIEAQGFANRRNDSNLTGNRSKPTPFFHRR